MIRKLHLTNATGRDATLHIETIKPPPGPKKGVVGHQVKFQRYLACVEEGLHESLQDRYGEDYAESLVAGDPEIDLERVGRFLPSTDTVYLSGAGDVLHASPTIVEIILGPDGKEREQREPDDIEANVNDELPVRWTGRKMARNKVVHRFVFRRTLQVKHVDGLTYDFLYAMAEELSAEDEMVLLGAGPRGRDPLIFHANGVPYRAFLEGRVDGPRYQLLLHLSNMELKRPESA